MKVIIIGAGIAGLTTALALKKYGIDSAIYEATPQIKPVGAGLGLGSNALMAFDWLNLSEEVGKAGRLISSFTIYDQKGKPITKTSMQPSSSFKNFTIHRADLQELLIKHLDKQQINLGKRAVDINQSHEGVTVRFSDNTTVTADLLLIADGIHSAIRMKLMPEIKPRYAGYTCWRTTISNAHLSINETSETWGPNGRFGIVPLPQNQLYWFACINAPENDPGMKKYTVQDLYENFRNYHDPIPAIISHSKSEHLIQNDIIDLPPLSKFSVGRALLLGDAAHATTPNMGQGACQAIEDAIVIAQCLHQEKDYYTAYKAFENRRRHRTEWIIENSRRIGKIAQMEGSVIPAIRNFLLRRLPSRLNENQLKKLSEVDFLAKT